MKKTVSFCLFASVSLTICPLVGLIMLLSVGLTHSLFLFQASLSLLFLSFVFFSFLSLNAYLLPGLVEQNYLLLIHEASACPLC